jgi:hypothetical protein
MKHSHSSAMTIFHTITKSAKLVILLIIPTYAKVSSSLLSGISSEGTSLIERLSNIVFGKFLPKF